MKAVQFLALSLIFSAPVFADISCATQASASCATEDGLCLEFFEESGTDEEVWQGLCDSSEGTYASTPCDTAKVAAKCMVPTNPMMPVINFLTPDFTPEDAKVACKMLQGKVCE